MEHVSYIVGKAPNLKLVAKNYFRISDLSRLVSILKLIILFEIEAYEIFYHSYIVDIEVSRGACPRLTYLRG